jgi:AcrR family transcriptional regulator
MAACGTGWPAPPAPERADVGRIAGGSADETRRRLLDSAAAEFDRQGFERTRVADIAAGASLSNGALYRHFESKSDLLASALAERAGRELDAVFLQANGRSVVELLTGIGRVLDRLPAGRGSLVAEALVAARRDREVAEVSSRHLSESQKWLAGLIEAAQAEGVVDQGLSAMALARLCLTMVLGSVLLGAIELPSVETGGWAQLIERIAQAVTA